MSVRYTPVLYQMPKPILNLFQPSGSPIIIVSSDPCADTQFQISSPIISKTSHNYCCPGASFTSNIHKICFSTELCPDQMGELTAHPRPPSRALWGRGEGRKGREGKVSEGKGVGGIGLGKREGRKREGATSVPPQF